MKTGLPSATFPFFSSVSEATRRELLALPVRQAPAHLQVLRKGDEVEGVYLVTGGALRVFHLAPDGREATLYWVEPGQTCILALTAAFRREPYPAWVETDASPVSYVLVPHQKLRAILAAEEAVREFVFEALSGRVFELMSTLAETAVLRVEARVAALLLRRAESDGTVHMTQARIAAHLGTAREVVFRALRALEARGLVETRRGVVLLCNRDELVATCGKDDDFDTAASGA
jgi:CRP/FNR family transcriptional regulator